MVRDYCHLLSLYKATLYLYAHVTQGRKKKPFIDKKKGTTYHLVPRSQADPLLDDPREPQHVLKPEKVRGEDPMIAVTFDLRRTLVSTSCWYNI